MKPRKNFLPKQFDRNGTKIFLRYAFRLNAILFTLFLLFVALYVINNRVSDSTISSHENENAMIAQTIEDLKVTLQNDDDYLEYMRIQEEVKNNNLTMVVDMELVQTLQKIDESATAKVQLMEITKNANDKNLVIKGQALHLDDINEFYKKLRESKLFDKAFVTSLVLVTSEEGDYEKTQVIEFTIDTMTKEQEALMPEEVPVETLPTEEGES